MCAQLYRSEAQHGVTGFSTPNTGRLKSRCQPPSLGLWGEIHFLAHFLLLAQGLHNMLGRQEPPTWFM